VNDQLEFKVFPAKSTNPEMKTLNELDVGIGWGIVETNAAKPQ
jgi:hypothetical protein